VASSPPLCDYYADGAHRSVCFWPARARARRRRPGAERRGRVRRRPRSQTDARGLALACRARGGSTAAAAQKPSGNCSLCVVEVIILGSHRYISSRGTGHAFVRSSAPACRAAARICLILLPRAGCSTASHVRWGRVRRASSRTRDPAPCRRAVGAPRRDSVACVRRGHVRMQTSAACPGCAHRRPDSAALTAGDKTRRDGLPVLAIDGVLLCHFFMRSGTCPFQEKVR